LQLDPPMILPSLDYASPTLEAIDPGIPAGGLSHPPLEPDDRADRQAVALSDLEVDWIVAGGDLDDSGAELRIDGLVGDDPHRDRPVDRRHLERLADVLGVPPVLGMHGQTRVAELRLRAYRSERQRP